jgi:predicted permease
MTGGRYRTREAQVQFERDVLDRLRAIPGVTAASASVGVPVIGGMGAGLFIEGRPKGAAPEEIAYFSVSPEFMSSFSIPIRAGRDLTFNDTAASPRVVLINETMARRYWPEGNALGARVDIGAGTPTGTWITVVGIVPDMRLHGPTEEIRPAAFGSTLQYSWPRRFFTVRADGARPALAADLRGAVRAVDPALAVGAITRVDELIDERTARHKLAMLTLSFFGVVALVLCALGLYAVVALTSQLRRREYAIRLALGAPRASVRAAVLTHALVLAAAGAAAGLGAAALGTRALDGMLHGVTPLDPLTFAAATAGVIAVAAIAAWLPARQAARVDPLEALRID